MTDKEARCPPSCRIFFQQGMEFVLENEVGNYPNGGLNHHPSDPGGLTKWGISQRANPDVDIENLTLEGAKNIYFARYWHPFSYCKIFSIAIAIKVFDLCVNMGAGGSWALVCRAVFSPKPSKALLCPHGFLKKGRGLPNCEEFKDNCSQQTDSMRWETLIPLINRRCPQCLMDDLIYFSIKNRYNLIKRNPRMKVFLRGWLKRDKRRPTID